MNMKGWLLVIGLICLLVNIVYFGSVFAWDWSTILMWMGLAFSGTFILAVSVAIREQNALMRRHQEASYQEELRFYEIQKLRDAELDREQADLVNMNEYDDALRAIEIMEELEGKRK